ncbi:MAG: hypothetical protein ACXVB9_15990 [Bdellovibrionota bacterium]
MKRIAFSLAIGSAILFTPQAFGGSSPQKGDPNTVKVDGVVERVTGNLAAAGSTACQTIGANTIYQNRYGTVIKNDDGIFVLAKGASCSAYSDADELRQSLTVSGNLERKALAKMAAECFLSQSQTKMQRNIYPDEEPVEDNSESVVMPYQGERKHTRPAF